MTDQDAKQYLRRYHEAVLNIESLTAEKERLESSLYSITSDPSSEGGGGLSKDKIGSCVARLTGLIEQISDEIDAYAKVRDDVRSIVRDVMDVNVVLGQCLHYRYIDFRGAVSTAYDMGYSPGNERRIHRRVFEAAARAIKRRAS